MPAALTWITSGHLDDRPEMGCARIRFPTIERNTVPRIKQYIAFGGAALCLVTISACGSSDDGDTATTASTTSAAPTTVVPDNVTEPGTELKVGQPAVVPWQDGYVSISVTAVEPGDTEAFRKAYGADADGLQPYYLRFTLENVGGTDLTIKNPPKVDAILSDGSTTGTFLTGSIDECKTMLTPDSFNTVGAKFETCELDAAAAEDEIVGAQYSGGDYDEKPILWRS
ncbi:hypothetical protein SacmaDRAFT_0185 [Saccharomonospora marina XMU15]|uniref:DUF4352 domain-containing protein n=1 Tax=Saccharomonospora marina XMU15 TaxID=882083 RepID=H5WZ96_9PSEU|nr:hypothetical protein [Saccharomonospora marina]EHR48497.1 hypothetical protein SacmaDRAFT_0185 [Saccharomonospora marina XMU15]